MQYLILIKESTLKVASIFPYIFCKFDTVELQKMCGRTKILQKLITNVSALQIYYIPNKLWMNE